MSVGIPLETRCSFCHADSFHFLTKQLSEKEVVWFFYIPNFIFGPQEPKIHKRLNRLKEMSLKIYVKVEAY